MQRFMFATYVDIEDQRHDEGQEYAKFLAHPTRAFALRSAEDEDRQQLMSHMHYVHRKGMQWEWYRGCKGMLEEWVAEWCRLKLQAVETHARQELKKEACIRQEAYGRYDLARQCY